MTTPPDDKSHRIGAVIVAAGRSTRMGGVDKTFAPLMGTALIGHTLSRFEASPVISEIVLALAEESVDRGRRLVSGGGYGKVTHVVTGGRRRQDSVRNGLLALAPCDYVMVHDGARPLVDGGMLERAARAVLERGAAVAGVPVKDTIKRVGPGLSIMETPDRSALWQAQTPQIFQYDMLLEAPPELPGRLH